MTKLVLSSRQNPFLGLRHLLQSIRNRITRMSAERKLHRYMKRMKRKAYSDIETRYAELIELLGQLDPIKLLSQLSLTFATLPEDEFVDESSDVHKWERWIEFLAGYLLVQDYPQNARKDIDGRDLERIEDLLTRYFKSTSLYLLSDKPSAGEDGEAERVALSARNYSLYVRGESYPHQLKRVAQDMYSQHEEWFVENLGFTISDALSISESVVDECNRRINDEKESCKERAREYVESLIGSGRAGEEEREDLETSVGVSYYFGNSDAILSFTLDELIRFSGSSREVCQRYLTRLSQEFGHRNVAYPETFNDPHLAPWDYNTLYERPLILHDGKYFVPAVSVLNQVLLHTFYYDLIADNEYWKKAGEKKYGAWLEQETGELLQRVFPHSEVWLNPEYPNGNELCDVLVLHDRNVFIVQCKTKRLRFESQIGKDFRLIKDDLTKGVAESFEQAIQARDYLLEHQPARLRIAGGELEVDSGQISNVFPMSVTLVGYQNLITRLANVNPALNLFSDAQYPWAISLFDLGVVTELIESPAMFIHYAKRRLAVERTNFDVLADEIDLLGFYLAQGLRLDTEDFRKSNVVSLSGFSTSVDRYMFEKHELGKNPEKPGRKMPARFGEYIEAIEKLNSAYKTDCAVRFLDLDFKMGERFVAAAETMKLQTKGDGGLHSVSTVTENSSLGFSFVAMDGDGNLDELYRQAFSFSVVKKYVTKCREWVGLGWDRRSKAVVDVAIFLSFDWQEDEVIAQTAKDYLKPGEMVGPDN